MKISLDAVVSAVATEVGLDPDNVSTDKTIIKRFINDTRREIASLPYHFKALEFSGEIRQALWVTAGTVSINQDASEVTGVGTSWKTASSRNLGYDGYYIKIGTRDYQRVSFVTDSTHLTLQTPWLPASLSTQSYTMYKRFYELPPRVDKVLRIVEPSKNVLLSYYESQEFYERYRNNPTFGDPSVYTQFGSSELGLEFIQEATFSSVTSTANSPILDFQNSAGVFLSTAMAPGDKLVVGDSTTSTAFYVESVLSQRKVSLTSFVSVSNAALSVTAMAFDRPTLEFYPAINGDRVMYFQAAKQVVDIIDGGTFIESGWYPAIKSGSIAKAMGYINSPKEVQKISEYNQALQSLIRNQKIALNPSPRLKPFILRRYGRQFGTIVGSDRDIW